MSIQVYYLSSQDLPTSADTQAEEVADINHLPGGKKILTRVAGKDASKQFWKYHNDGILKKYKSKPQVGSLDTKAAPPTPPATPPPAEKKEVAKPRAESGTLSAVPAKGVEKEEVETLEPFGDLIPFADPSWYQGVCLFPPCLRIQC